MCNLLIIVSLSGLLARITSISNKYNLDMSLVTYNCRVIVCVRSKCLHVPYLRENRIGKIRTLLLLFFVLMIGLQNETAMIKGIQSQ